MNNLQQALKAWRKALANRETAKVARIEMQILELRMIADLTRTANNT